MTSLGHKELIIWFLYRTKIWYMMHSLEEFPEIIAVLVLPYWISFLRDHVCLTTRRRPPSKDHLTHGPWEIWMKFRLVIFKLIVVILDQYFMWNCPQMHVTGVYSWFINIGSGNGLVPSGNKPLTEPMLSMSPNGVNRLQWFPRIKSYEFHMKTMKTDVQSHNCFITGWKFNQAVGIFLTIALSFDTNKATQSTSVPISTTVISLPRYKLWEAELIKWSV